MENEKINYFEFNFTILKLIIYEFVLNIFL